MRARRHYTQPGFTLMELLVVVAIMLAVSTAALPSVMRSMANIKLRTSMESAGGLLQKARIQAVRDNKFYSAVTNNISGTSDKQVCVDNNWSGTCTAGEYLIQMAGQISLASSPPSTALITCGPGASSTGACPSGYATGLNFTPEASSVVPSFSARGLPCVRKAGVSTQPVYPTDVCTTLDPTTSNPVGFLYVYQYTGYLGTSYGAVSVTPAGRVSIWMYEGKDSGNNDTWSN